MSDERKRIVFVGGGHSHVLAILRLSNSTIIAQYKPEIVLISDAPTAWYSGMLPACCAK
jgi:NADH dehydrogenase FAD-containing subunit